MPGGEHFLAESATEEVARRLTGQGWMFVNGDRFALGKAFSRFRADSRDTWESLPADPYAPPDTGRYRCYGRLLWQADARAGRFRGRLLRAPHLPYHQKAEVNALAGGIDRTFAPLPEHISGSALVRRLLRFDLAAAGARHGLWEVDMHMVRIAPGPGGLGRPAPEGVHRDGLDAIAIHLIEASGVEGGVSSVFDDEGRELGRVRLTHPLDSLLVDDRRLRHFTTPVRRRHTVVAPGPSRGRRDVLLVGMRRSTGVDGPTSGSRRDD